jgi:hypothetical protein
LQGHVKRVGAANADGGAGEDVAEPMLVGLDAAVGDKGSRGISVKICGETQQEWEEPFEGVTRKGLHGQLVVGGWAPAAASEIWFSTANGFTSTNQFDPTNQISAGDLLSNRGRVVKQNSDLMGWLGLMPPVPDLGLDAVQVRPDLSSDSPCSATAKGSSCYKLQQW